MACTIAHFGPRLKSLDVLTYIILGSIQQCLFDLLITWHFTLTDRLLKLISTHVANWHVWCCVLDGFSCRYCVYICDDTGGEGRERREERGGGKREEGREGRREERGGKRGEGREGREERRGKREEGREGRREERGGKREEGRERREERGGGKREGRREERGEKTEEGREKGREEEEREGKIGGEVDPELGSGSGKSAVFISTSASQSYVFVELIMNLGLKHSVLPDDMN